LMSMCGRLTRRSCAVNAVKDLVNFTAPIEDAGTTHLSVIDSQRNAVSLTSTVRTPSPRPAVLPALSA
jgi:gamma-glutamyltranspeptidase